MEARCAMCGESGALHCERDDAFLCWTCDMSVHSHNSIVVRHIRSVLCSTCNAPTRFRASGGSPVPFTCVCAECSPGVCDANLEDVNDDVSDRMSSTSCAQAEERRAIGARLQIGPAKTKESQQASSCAGLGGNMYPHVRRRIVRHICRRYRKAPRHTSSDTIISVVYDSIVCTPAEILKGL